ncbi:MAG: peptidase, partial [Metallibacterium scheffleri]
MQLSPIKPVVLAIGLALSCVAAAADNSVFNVNELDTQVSACSNLNTFVNAKWVAAHPIPADKTRWGAFDELAEKSLDIQHAIVQQAARNAAT